MKSIATSALIIASLALTGNAAMAATSHVHKIVKPHVVHARVVNHVASRRQYPVGQYGFNAGQFFQSLFGGPFPYAQVAHATGKTRGEEDAGTYDSSSWSPSYETSVPVDNGAQQAAQQASDMANEAQAEADMQMAQQQNDEANAEFTAGILAAQQTEINANN